MLRRLFPLSLLLLIGALGAGIASDKSDKPGAEAEKEEHPWLAEVDLLLTEAEREAFESLEQEYQRQSFIRRFWQSRDPFPGDGAQ